MRVAPVAGALMAMSLAACGGGGGGGSGLANQVPVANAGPDQSTVSGSTVTLNGSASSDPDGTVSQFSWTQTAGPAVTLSPLTSGTPAFCAPTVTTQTVLTFALSVTDNAGAVSPTPDSVNITVSPHPGGTVALTGEVRFERVPLLPVTGGLDYTGKRMDPARGITLEAVCGGQQVLATTNTDASGVYSFNVPASTTVSLRARAQMLRSAPQWQFRVVDDGNGNQIYTHTGAAFDSSAPGGAQNLSIPSGFGSTGTVTGTRAAAPFAILDTIYKALLAIDAVQPGLAYPALDIDWSPQNEGGNTFFRNGPGTPLMVLAGEVNVDTDEYDEHVVAHEFGHYVENAFSRSDSIGGPHTAGDRLDLRVAFGEGFGYAFAGMVLGESVSRDTGGQNQAQASRFDMESRNTQNPGWFSEASVWAVLWDLFDPANESHDSLALGFAPLWTVLTGEQRNTDAVTSIFPFISALKTQRPGDVAAINSIVANEAIQAATIEPYGGTETNAGGVSPSTDVFPIYTSIAMGETKEVRSVAVGSGGNKLSGHRLLRFPNPIDQNVRFRVNTLTPGRDVDIRIFRRGQLVQIFQEFGNENGLIQNLAAGEYVLDVYDCENAECADQPSYNYQPTLIQVILSNN